MQHRGRGRGRGGGFRGGFRGRGGGGGRGQSNAPNFRGGGGGRGAYSGPTLPFSLTREIGMDASTSGAGGGGGGGSKRRERDESQLDRRRHVGDGKKKKRKQRRSPSPDNDDDRAFFNEDNSDALAPSPSPPPPSHQHSKKPRTKFEELLLNGGGLRTGGGGAGDRLLAGTGPAAAEAEAALQRRLAKQLGLRGKAKKRALAQPEGLFVGNRGSGAGDAKEKKDKVSVPERRRKREESSDSEEEEEESASDVPPLSDSDDDCFGLNANLENDEDSAEDEEDSGEELEVEEEEEEGRDGEADLFSSSDDDDGSSSDSDSDSDSGSDDEKARDDAPSAAAAVPPRTPQQAGQYLPPAARAAAAAEEARKKGENDAAGSCAAESAAVLRRVRGLLNRLAEANLRGVSGDVAALFSSSSSTALVREALCSELVSASARGPRASAAFASAAAALVAAVAANVRSPRLAAEFAASTAVALEEALRGGKGGGRDGGEGDDGDDDARVDSTSVSNLGSLVCALHAAGVLRPAAMFSYLHARFARFDRDADVAAAALVLRSSGARLRAEDPAALKEAVLSAAARAAEARSKGRLSARGEALLSLVLDVKNNRRGGGSGEQQQQAGALSAATMRWLRSGAPSSSNSSSSVNPTSGEEHYALHGVTWEALVAPTKRGQWWLPSAVGDKAGGSKAGGSGGELSSSAARVRLAEDEDDENGAGGLGGGLETDDLLALAAAQRMNSTPSRRACFCAAMGAADAADGAERLLRLPLRGAAARDAVRVPLACALREASWNPYYPALLSRLARAKRAHRASLVLALRDELRDAAEGGVSGGGDSKQKSIAAATLARLAGALVAGHVVPLSSLLPREEARMSNPAAASASASARCGLSAGSDALAALLPPRRIALWRSLLRHALAAAPDRAAAASPFERMSAAALAAKKNAGSSRGGRAFSARDGSDGDDDDLDGFAEARLEKRRRKGNEDGAKDAKASSPAFPPLDASEACASLRSFIRRFVVPGVDGSSSSIPASNSMFAGVSLDELTLRARGAERALAAGAKAAGQSFSL